MTRCAIVNCSNTSDKGEAANCGISFHRFPNDPLVKNKWIEATGRKQWFPKNHSRTCSVHFHADSFTGPSKYRRLISKAYPTTDVVMVSNDEKIKGQSSSEKDSKNNTPQKRKLEMDINEPSTSDQIPIHTPKMKKKLKQLNNPRQMIKQKDKQIKRLKEQNRRKVKRIRTLVALLGCLKKNTLISDEEADNLKTTNVTTNELYSRQMKNTKGSATTSKYSPALRSFELTFHYYSSKAYNYVRKIFNLSLPHPVTIRNRYKVIDGLEFFPSIL